MSYSNVKPCETKSKGYAHYTRDGLKTLCGRDVAVVLDKAAGFCHRCSKAAR
jgi:hypothetical protein